MPFSVYAPAQGPIQKLIECILDNEDAALDGPAVKWNKHVKVSVSMWIWKFFDFIMETCYCQVDMLLSNFYKVAFTFKDIYTFSNSLRR